MLPIVGVFTRMLLNWNHAQIPKLVIREKMNGLRGPHERHPRVGTACGGTPIFLAMAMGC